MSLGLETNQYYRKRRTLQLILGICIAASILISSLLVIFLRPAHAAELSPDDFVLTVKTDIWDEGENLFTVSTNNAYSYNYDIDWNNDGEFDQLGVTHNARHSFETPGTYTIRIRGAFPAYQCDYFTSIDCRKITAIDQWGSGAWQTMAMAFYDTSALKTIPAAAPNLSEVTDMSGMFMFSGFNGDVSNWDTSHVTNMNMTFRSANSFTGDVSGWNTSNVTTMSWMFGYMSSFNGDLSNWDTSNVTDMSGMFSGATAFNSDLSDWDTSNVTDMSQMFFGADAFNDSLANWSMSQVVTADRMFSSSGLTLENYTATLDGWSQQALQTGVALGAPDVGYCSIPSREFIIETFSWVIERDWVTPACTVSFDGLDFYALLQENLPVGTSVGTLKADAFVLRSTQPYTLGCAVPGADDSFFTIGGVGGDQLRTNELFAYTEPDESTFARVSSSARGTNTYEVCVKAHTINGDIVENYLHIGVTMAPRVKAVTSSAFSHEDGKTLLTVKGEWLIDNVNRNEIYDSYERSLVNLNGVDLAFCADTMGVTAAEIIAAEIEYSPNIAQLVTDTPPCYRLKDADWNNVITPTQAVIVLPADYDTSAQGTVSVNNSNTYTFNAPVDETTPVQPDANVNGTKPLPQHPTIPVRPTFSGVAEPGARVTVTVHSDPVTCMTTANATGNWSCTLASDLPAGEHTVYVQVINPDSSVVDLGPYAVTVDGSTSGVVTPTSPRAPGAPNTGLFETIRAKRAQDIAQATEQRNILVGVVSAAAVVGLATAFYGLHRYRLRRSVSFDNK